MVGNLVGFGTFYSDLTRPDDIINAVVNHQIDVAIVWGPLAGYFVARDSVPLVMNVIESDSLSGIPFAFSISAATRRRDRALRDSLQTFLDTKNADIQALLHRVQLPAAAPAVGFRRRRTGPVSTPPDSPRKERRPACASLPS